MGQSGFCGAAGGGRQVSSVTNEPDTLLILRADSISCAAEFSRDKADCPLADMVGDRSRDCLEGVELATDDLNTLFARECAEEER